MGLGTEQLAARKAYKEADAAVQAGIAEVELAKEAVREAEERVTVARRRVGLEVDNRRRWADECQRLGIDVRA